MIVSTRDFNLENVPRECYVPPGQLFIKKGYEYKVYAVAVHMHMVKYLIDSGIKFPEWYPAWYFDVVDKMLPNEWRLGAFHGDLSLILGPEFISGSEGGFYSLLSLERDQVDLFWEMVEVEKNK